MSDIIVTDVRVKLSPPGIEKLVGYCAMTLNDAIVVKDIKVIEGDAGLFIAMPSRKITRHCPHCRTTNPVRANYCNECGKSVRVKKIEKDRRGRERLHFDVVHPINAEVRAYVHDAIMSEVERVRSGQVPGADDSVNFARDQ